jgi:tetratricopeptide (TPR) repeat protein/nucleoside phosphorylase
MPASDAMQPIPKRKAVILTALPVEFQAVLAHLTGSREEVHSSGTVYERGDFQSESGTWDVLLVETGAGNARAALEVERAIQYFSPEVALFVGVAGGLKDVNLGDVVFASKVYSYEAGKASVGFEPRPETGEGSYVLLQRARAVARNTRWLRRLGQSLEGRQPRALPGPIAAGEKVIAETRSQEYQFLRQQYGDALAVEMEGRGFLTGTWANRNVEALVIRGISDLIDRKAEADALGSQELASKHASAFAFEVLARFVLPDRASAPVMARPSERARLWMVPISRNQNFTGRAVLLQAIREHFLANPSRPAPLALFGLGGVGKTQLAVEYASRYALDERSYSQVFWLRSDEPSVLASSYAGLTRELDLPEKSETEHELKVRAVQQWLQWNEGWLLVFDNAEEPSAVRPYLPLVHRGHVLITSRNATWGELATPLPVQVLERAESIEFLRTRTRQEDAQAAAALAEALGDLPLALAQAAAYIEQTGRTLGGYLALFERRRQELLTHPPVPADYPHTVAATWDLSLEQVRTQSPAAVDLLALCAFLAPSPLPTAWLTEGARVLPSSLSEVLADELRMDEALGTLRRYSLVQLSQQELMLHRLVQAVMSARLAEARGSWAEAALCLVYELFNVDTDDLQKRARCVALLPHCLAAARNAWELRCGLDLLPKLLSLMGHFWDELAEFSSSVHAFEWGLEVTREVHGKDHVAEAEILAGLASVEFVLGKFNESQEHLDQALRLVRAAPEEEPRGVDESSLLDQLALVFLKRGALREAREHAERAHALRVAARVEGSSDVEPFSSTLGMVLLHQARFDEALVHFERALKSAEARLGPAHPNVAAAAGQLAGALEMLGRYGEARDLLERGVKVLEATYGPEHPNVAAFMRLLGALHQRVGELTRARDCCERALRIDEARLGPQHLDVAADLNNLARAHHELGDLQRARSYFERALAIQERELGSRHIGLATVLDNLGRVHEELRNLQQARACFERALAIHEQEHAADHPAIANVLNNLGHLLECTGELPRARACLERALDIDEKAYGPDHPEVATDLANLASILLKQGERTLAEQHIERVLAIHEERSATEPVDLIRFLLGVGTRYQNRQEWDAAKPYLVLPRRLVDGDVSTLVDGHAARMESPHWVMEWAGRRATGS